MLVEKRVAGIIRWLERLKKSYSSGAMESALMDAECARADLENLRQVVWAEVRPSPKHEHSLLSRVLSSMRTLSLAGLIVMLSVVPISREVPAPARPSLMTKHVPPEPIIVIREYEPPKQPAQVQPRKQTVQKRTVQKRVQPPQVPNSSAPKTQTPPGTVPFDKVYSLIQTGQRALKNNSSVIKLQ